MRELKGKVTRVYPKDTARVRKAKQGKARKSNGVPAFVHRTGTSSYDGVCDGSATSKPHLPLAGW